MVSAFTERGDGSDADVTASASLRFPDGRVRVEPAYPFSKGLGRTLWRGDGDEGEHTAFDARDQVAAELVAFARSVREGSEPEPGGQEGLADVRIIQALHRSAREGRPVRLDRVERQRRPGMHQEICRPAHEEQPELVDERPPA